MRGQLIGAFALLLLALPVRARAVTLTVAKSGGEYRTIQAAIDAVPDNSSTYYAISIGAGTYGEYLTVPATKLHLTMVGAIGDPADVHIDGSRYAGLHSEVPVLPEHLQQEQLPLGDGRPGRGPGDAGGPQSYLDCVFYGHQDTLLSWSSTPSTDIRQYVHGGEVEGDVDSIFGNGTLVVDRSHIKVLDDGIYSSGALAAPATYTGQTYGILITGSTVTSTLADGTVYLGRAWVPYTGAVPQMVVRDTSLPSAIAVSAPWTGISGASWTSGRYGEHGNSGSGATVNSNRPQLSSSTAASYTAAKYLAGTDGWSPAQ